MNKSKILVFIPTYNEKENVQVICSDIINLELYLDILFLDDNSPDGTGEILDQLVEKNDNVHVIHRSEKRGIGSAHVEGINWAYDKGYSLLVTMDCDFTHSPEYIPDFIEKSSSVDIVIGNRYMLKDSLKDWSLFRKILTKGGHLMSKLLLKLEYDTSGAFRLYKLEKIPRNIFNLIESVGYSFFYESLYVLNLNNFAINEIPIKLPKRTSGHSKMRVSDAFLTIKMLFIIYFNSLKNEGRYELGYSKKGNEKS